MSGKPLRDTAPNFVLAILSLGFLMTFIDLTVMNVAIPAISADLNVGMDSLLWAVNSYVLVVSFLLITMGRLGDIVGTRNMFLLGVALFSAASAGVGASRTAAQMISFRALQGVGTSMLLPQTLAILVQVFPPEKRGAAFGTWGTVAGAAAIAGPFLGGLVVSTVGWRWIFLINVPVGLLVLPLGWQFLPVGKSAQKASLDILGAILISVVLFSVTYIFMEIRSQGWSVVMQAFGGAAAVAALILFRQQSRRQDQSPLIPFGLFSAEGFATMNLVMACSSISIVALMLIISIFLQTGLNYSAFYAGLAIVPASLMSMLLARYTGGLTDRYSGRNVVFSGLLISAAGVMFLIWAMNLAVGGTVSVADAGLGQVPEKFWYFIAPMVLVGIGNACVVAPTNATAMRRVPSELAGAASGILNTVRQIGFVGAVTMTNFLIEWRIGQSLDVKAQKDAALMAHALPDVMWLPAAAMITGAIVCRTVRGADERVKLEART
ncbi:EmrB/QacA subfamily drug resistance transporter [Bradyrhizobium huanghuaihaiense]|uniref:EmrB/QacA subfamily drug resistance transporter n=1 Tax=Bradyrhizobium huanghuaihaiense TaxID=990078 RepID=A0A562R3Z5_9BRAD|nr:MFS transporter [Bradyrhizobium huanghuaihaiense]TWI63802.1 EmrB/QacA subfamily drug resistance transporter [Bradyrhizobium huanghuaihaiense]